MFVYVQDVRGPSLVLPVLVVCSRGSRFGTDGGGGIVEDRLADLAWEHDHGEEKRLAVFASLLHTTASNAQNRSSAASMQLIEVALSPRLRHRTWAQARR